MGSSQSDKGILVIAGVGFTPFYGHGLQKNHAAGALAVDFNGLRHYALRSPHAKPEWDDWADETANAILNQRVANQHRFGPLASKWEVSIVPDEHCGLAVEFNASTGVYEVAPLYGRIGASDGVHDVGAFVRLVDAMSPGFSSAHWKGWTTKAQRKYGPANSVVDSIEGALQYLVGG